MRILITTDTYLPMIGGIPNAVLSLTQYLKSSKIFYRLIAPGPKVKDEEDVYRLTYFNDPFIKGKTGAIFPLAFFQIRDIIKKDDPTVIHIEEAGGIGVSSLFWGKIYRKKIIGTVHTDPKQVAKINNFFRLIPFLEVLIKKYLVFFYNKCDVITTPGESYLKNMNFSKKTVVIPNGVDLTEYFPAIQKNNSFLAKYNLPSNKKIFLYLGRLDPDKNIEFLIRSFAKLNRDDSILLIVGVGALASYLKLLVSSYHNIIVIFEHDQKDIPCFYRNSDVFVTASKIEVQSLTALEAMASGLPIIAARAGGMVDLCKDSVNGFLFKPDDFNDFIDKTEKILKNKVKFSQMKKESRRLAEEHDLNRCMQKYVDLYKYLQQDSNNI